MSNVSDLYKLWATYKFIMELNGNILENIIPYCKSLQADFIQTKFILFQNATAENQFAPA